MKTFGLIGKNIDYSFSRDYFKKKFQYENIIDSEYVNFDISNISEIKTIFKSKKAGFNVTIPYKVEIIPFLDKLNADAKSIGAVNTIKVHKDGSLEGFNTDFYGFMRSVQPFLKSYHKKALILGTGGASNAVAYALKQMNIDFIFVSRDPQSDQINYNQLNKSHFDDALIIINTTPVGTFPEIHHSPNIPYQYFTSKHLAYDLIYNPNETEFLKKAKENGAKIINGLNMLILQAEKSWEIWNN